MMRMQSFISHALFSLLVFTSTFTFESIDEFELIFQSTQELLDKDFYELDLHATTADYDEPYALDDHCDENAKNKTPEKEWTFIIYMAADNDLRSLAARNIKQMAQVGSTDQLNIIVHLDIRLSGNKKVTRRYYVAKNKIIHLNGDDAGSQHMDSGSPDTLISCCHFAIENYPAQHYALMFWNHGSGIIDPGRGRIINPTDLFKFNPDTFKLELNRTIGFLDYMAWLNRQERGICWDDSTGNYLTNQKLSHALHTIFTQDLHGKKFDIIGFDACLMSMLEVCSLVKDYADIIVASQEVVLGTGWEYGKLFAPFEKQSITPEQWATHCVLAYEQSYKPITNDYTLSAIKLTNIASLENNINQIAYLLLQAFQKQTHNSVTNMINICRNKNNCTHFDEPSYIDLHHFYTNLLQHLSRITLQNAALEKELKINLQQKLEEGCKLITSLVFCNVTGKNLANARGVSIYFPLNRIHPSYRTGTFATHNQWGTFLMHYLAS